MNTAIIIVMVQGSALSDHSNSTQYVWVLLYVWECMSESVLSGFRYSDTLQGDVQRELSLTATSLLLQGEWYTLNSFTEIIKAEAK